MTGTQLREWRERLGVKQTKLAESMGVNARTIQNWEKKADDQLPRYVGLALAAHICGVRPYGEWD